MKSAKKVFERVYIHAAKIRTTEGWVLVISAMDAASEYVYEPTFHKSTEINLTVLKKVFNNILEDYNPVFHPRIITFITNLPEHYLSLILQTNANRHKFVFNKELTKKAMNEFLNNLHFDMEDI